MTRLIIHQAHRSRCFRCATPMPKAGAVVEDSAGVRAFVCVPHLAELSQVCRIDSADGTLDGQIGAAALTCTQLEILIRARLGWA